MQEMIIRQACPEDAEQVLSYLKQIGSETENLTFGPEGLPISVEEEKRHIQSAMEAPHSVMYLVLKDGIIVGNGSLNGLSRRMAHRADLGISVAKAEWNKGIGSLLMQRLIAYARDNGIEILSLEVRADNQSAIHLYEKFGFQKIGVFPAFFRIGAEYIDFTLMHLDLRR